MMKSDYVFYYESGLEDPDIRAVFHSKQKFVDFLQANKLPMNDLNIHNKKEWPAVFWNHEDDDGRYHLCTKVSVDPHTIAGLVETINDCYRKAGIKPIILQGNDEEFDIGGEG